eukprot:CAMPEP_0206428762 /NCGR_PEP_ID=MMETSP0324_2-20121206/5855_1 /ASSEMBLY_ACC=CAM_ASM_000836 /TAXON_ID=2866 /ORGANISM="Crypthecodinium cohnii, Strain Seligo" /LENGTH=57 /DNA_ID=CAMNT_0053894347 /DNA_START=77 /DNA_END=246 /DNA_ORIENTATION=+
MRTTCKHPSFQLALCFFALVLSRVWADENETNTTAAAEAEEEDSASQTFGKIALFVA